MKDILDDLIDWVNGLFEQEQQPVPVHVPVRNEQRSFPSR